MRSRRLKCGLSRLRNSILFTTDFFPVLHNPRPLPIINEIMAILKKIISTIEELFDSFNSASTPVKRFAHANKPHKAIFIFCELSRFCTTEFLVETIKSVRRSMYSRCGIIHFDTSCKQKRTNQNVAFPDKRTPKGRSPKDIGHTIYFFRNCKSISVKKA